MLGASKACASILLQTFAKMHGLNTVELRLFTPYGPWESPRRLIPSLILAALQQQDVPLSLGAQQRDFVYMDDVIDALYQAAVTPVPGGSVFNIGSGVGTTVRGVAELTLQLMGDPVRLKVGELPTRPDEIMEMSADIAAAKDQLGWQPRTSLKDGLIKTIDWLTENRDLAWSLS
jgi:nucleoside-diphosphate-sugar epimerase